MTLKEVKELDKDFITPAIAASVIGCDANNIRLSAHRRPELIPFPVMVVGTRTKIPRLPFIAWVESREQDALYSQKCRVIEALAAVARNPESTPEQILEAARLTVEICK